MTKMFLPSTATTISKVAVLLVGLALCRGGEAFSPLSEALLSSVPPYEKDPKSCTSRLSHQQALWATPRGGDSEAGGLFGRKTKTTSRGGGTGFGSPANNKKTKKRESKSGDDDGFTASKTLLEIEASEIKVGPLRFLLQLFLSGEVMNRPTPKSWFIAQRGVGDDGTAKSSTQTIEVYYQDGTGMVSIELQPNKIQINRVGVQPSLVYQLQESVLLHSVLDELTKVAFEQPEDQQSGPIDPSKRLLQLQNDRAIDEARKTLPARAEESS